MNGHGLGSLDLHVVRGADITYMVELILMNRARFCSYGTKSTSEATLPPPLQTTFPNPLGSLSTIRLEPTYYQRSKQVVGPLEVEGTKEGVYRDENDRPVHQRPGLLQCLPTLSQVYRHNQRIQYATDGNPRCIECRIHEFDEETRQMFPAQIRHTAHDEEPGVDLHC